MKKTIFKISTVLALVFTAAGVSLSIAQSKSPPLNETPPALKLNDPLPSNLFIELARVINPSVVNISTTTLPKRGSLSQRDPMADLFEYFYGPGFQMPQARPATALGTGFIIREDGLIITNNHVIEGADVVNVQLTEGEEKFYEATVIGRDSRTDIALIKIKSDRKLTAAALGTSKDVQVGEWVAAFGNPFGHGHTMTKGIVSAKSRAIRELNALPFIQTDASINPGNSGGPLVNARGQVIGVNTAIDARAQGIGFAIPIDEVKSILPQLETRGKIRRGYIGVLLDELDPRAAKSLGLKEDQDGVVITQVEPKGPADRGGVKPYDVVIEFNDKKIKDPMDLMDAVQLTTVGQNAKMKVLRDGKERVLTIPIIERPDEPRIAGKQERKYFGQKAPFDLGFTVADLNKARSEEIGVAPQFAGRPVVIEVERTGIAGRAGLRPGDVILDINRRPVRRATDVIKNFKKGNNTLRVARGQNVALITLETK